MFLFKSPQFFSQENDLVICNDVCSVIEPFKHQHNPAEWHLFTDSSKVSLKAVLLYNGNTFPPVPLGHVPHMKESYKNAELVWKRSSMKNKTRTYVGIYRSLLSCLATQSFVDFCVNGMVWI